MSFREPNESSGVMGKPVRGRERATRLAGERAAAGFPSPAEEYLERALDLNELLVQRPEATYFLRVAGESMTGAGIHDGDILVVDRSLAPNNSSVVVALVDGGFMVRYFRMTTEDTALLVADDPGCDPVVVTPESGCEFWGVVMFVIHRMQA